MIFPDKLDFGYSKSFTEATQIAKLVKAVGKSVNQVDVGDFIVVLSKNSDKLGKIIEIERDSDHFLVSLQTSGGVEKVKLQKNSLIHVIKKADMDLKKHDSYERDLHNVKNDGVPTTEKDKHHNFPPTTKDDTKVDSGKESAFPATKKLSLRNRAYQFAASDIVYSSRGEPAQIIEILPGDETQAAMAVLRSIGGESHFVEFLTDLEPAKSGEVLALRNSVKHDDVAKKYYGKKYNSLSTLEKLDVNDNILKLN